jgi:hypothetical protein
MSTNNITIKVLPTTGETIGEVQKDAKKRQEQKLVRLYKKNKQRKE